MTKRVRVALIGAGRIDLCHARTLAFHTPGAALALAYAREISRRDHIPVKLNQFTRKGTSR